MHKGFLKTAVIIAAISVISGAFGAHYLKAQNIERAVTTFETAVRYQFYHAFALLIAAMLYKDFPFKSTLWACRLFLIGIILFCGSLYFLTYIQATVMPGYNFIGALTPFGGLAFILGWLCLLISFFKKNNAVEE